jgi:hypothetical protein
MIERMVEYYESLLVDLSNQTSRQPLSRIFKRLVPPTELEHHEMSRVELLVHTAATTTNAIGRTSNPKTFRIGSVSYWGDAVSRACNMVFAGGGGGARARAKKGIKQSSNSIKREYVHIVQASVVDPSTWSTIIAANSTLSDPDHKASTMLGIAPLLLPYLTHPIGGKDNMVVTLPPPSEAAWIPLQDLTIDPMATKSNPFQVFRPLKKKNNNNNNRKSNLLSATGNIIDSESNSRFSNQRPKFPLMGPLSSSSSLQSKKCTSRNLEELSCPFDFLF